MQISGEIKKLYEKNRTLLLVLVFFSAILIYYVGSYLAGSLFKYGILFFIGCLILLRFPFLGFLLLIILIPAEELIVLPGGRTGIFVLGILVAFFWLINVLFKNGKICINKNTTLLAILLFFWGFISYFWAEDQSIVLTRILNFLNLVIFYILFQDFVKDNRRLKTILFAIFFSCVICSIASIAMESQTDVKRISLTEGQNPNMLSLNLGVGLLLVPYVFRNLKNNLLRGLLYIGVFTLIIAIILTGSRSTWLAIPIAVLFVWLITKGKILRIQSGIIPGIILTLIITFLIHSNFISPYLSQRFITMIHPEETHGGSGRLDIWTVGLAMVEDNPVFGVGLSNFPVRFGDYIGKRTTWSGKSYGVHSGRDPHNIFLSIQAELGIIGIFLFFLFIWYIVKPLIVYLKDIRAVIGILLIIFALIYGFTHTIQWTKIFWLVFAIATVIPNIIKAEKNENINTIAYVSK